MPALWETNQYTTRPKHVMATGKEEICGVSMQDRGFQWWLAHEYGLELADIAKMEKADIGDVIRSVVEVGEPYGVMFVAAG